MRIDVSLSHRDMQAELASVHARMRCPGDVLHGLSGIPASLPGIALRYRETDGEFYVYAEDTEQNLLAGCTVFNHAFEADRRTARFIRSPHSRYAAGYRRRGIASAVYRWALGAGLCLVTGPRQSPAAHGLWMALARTHELAFVQLQERRLKMLGTCVDRSVFDKFETRMLLMGSGWTLQRFASAANCPNPFLGRTMRIAGTDLSLGPLPK
jgi:hypothetical protein